MGTKTKQKSSAVSDSTTTNDPAAWAKDNYTTGAADSLKAYQSGVGSQVYQGPRTPDALSAQTQQGQGNLDTAANGFMPQQSQSAQNLASLASGGGNNPYFNQQLNNLLSNVSSDTNNSAAAQGIGSSAQNQQLGTAMGQAATKALSDQYNTNIGNQLAANNQIDNQLQNYAKTKADLANGQVKSGLITTGLQQAQENAAQQKFNEEQMQPWKQLGLLAAGTNSFAGPYGTSHSHGTSSATGTGSTGGAGMAAAGLSSLLSGFGASGLAGLL